MTTGQSEQLETLIIRGVPPRYAASQLGIPNEEADNVAINATNRGMLDDYQRACVERVNDDEARHDAAVYLYVRSIPTSVIKKVCGLPAGYKFDARDKMAFQDRQIELARQNM